MNVLFAFSFIWPAAAIVLAAALLALLLLKGRGWLARLMPHGGSVNQQKACLEMLERLGLSGKELKDDQGDVYAIEFSYRQMCFIMELSQTQEGDGTTLIVPNLHQGYIRDMDQILFCVNRHNCHPHLQGRAIVALVKDGNAHDEPQGPDLDVRILEPIEFTGNTRKDAKLLQDRLERLLTSTLWLLSLLDKMRQVQPLAGEASDTASESEQQRLQEVMDYLNPTHLPS